MSKKTKIYIVIGVVSVILCVAIGLLINSSELAKWGRQSSAEYDRIENISKTFKVPAELTLIQKTKMYDSLSTADGAGWEYRYHSSKDSHQTCMDVRKELQAEGFETSTDSCIDYPKTSIEELRASDKSRNVGIYVRTEGDTIPSSAKIEWNNLQ